ncbi:NADH-quinone oxidoreductase subunit J [Wolbachia endosymbiont of Oedothorax gibbosus]|uniref:NADH-quinone oxidoreductase subunit J n=1 Tax=Wolbachia endosymbiont of Oedothorax gibbosus TaxID=931100 RepID=UPI00202476A7|nr:NADH-quinone oxidoreductase subunit J [Wolbachia endosymbiont of Oedothorax gibbosus]
MPFFFYFFAILSILSAVCVISVRNPVHAVLFLIFTFVNSAVLFILLGAEFIAMMVLIVYIGAVAVLFLFVVMMLDIRLRQGFAKHFTLGAILCVVFFLVISFVIRSSAPNISNVINYNTNNVEAIGNLLYTDYMYAFHLSGILLLVAIVGAIALTLQDKKKEVKKQNVLKQLTQSSSVKLVKAKFGKGVEWK